MIRRFASILLGVWCLSGCAASATQVGQTAGGLLGGLLVPGIGAGLGALVGTVAGLAVDQELDKAHEKKERVELSQQLQPRPGSDAVALPHERLADAPAGQPSRVWVDEAMQDGSVLAGHFEERVIP